MDMLLIVGVMVLSLLLITYNHLLAAKTLRKESSKFPDAVSDFKAQEMSVRAVKAYTLGEYIVITTVIQRGSSKRSISEVVVDEPSLLIPLVSLSDESNEGSQQI